jgi:hypothetical protein
MPLNIITKDWKKKRVKRAIMKPKSLKIKPWMMTPADFNKLQRKLEKWVPIKSSDIKLLTNWKKKKPKKIT